MRRPGLLALVFLTLWIGAFAQTATKPPVHHTVKPVAARVDPVASAMKAVTVALKPNEDIGATYLFTNGMSDQADTTYSKITTVGCVLSYTVTVDQSATDKSGSHVIRTHVMDLKNAVPIRAVPDPGLYRHDADLDMAHSQPFYGIRLGFTIPQPRQSASTTSNAKGPLPEKYDSRPQVSTSFQSKTLEDSVHLKDAINTAIQACGGTANVAPPEPVVSPVVQNPPAASVKDTTDFISSKINDTVIFSQGVATFPDGSSAPMRQWLTQTISFLGADGCAVRWRIHIKRKQQDTSTRHWDDGQDDDYDSGTALAQSFHATSSRISEWSPEDQWSPSIYRISMPFNQKGSLTLFAGDQEMANRLQRALIGMGKICGAKDEPY